jgi:hypothetical protein
MCKNKFSILLIFVVLSLIIAAPTSAKGTTRTPVTYFECATPVEIGKEWSPDGNFMMRNVSYISTINTFSDDRFSGTLYGIEKVVISHKNDKAIFQGTATIVLPDDRGVWEGSWIGDGELGVHWQINIVFHGVAGEVEGLKAFITTTSDESYWCANSAGEIVNPGGE